MVIRIVQLALINYQLIFRIDYLLIIERCLRGRVLGLGIDN